jgi:hypothetical protein
VIIQGEEVGAMLPHNKRLVVGSPMVQGVVKGQREPPQLVIVSMKNLLFYRFKPLQPLQCWLYLLPLLPQSRNTGVLFQRQVLASC